MKAELRIHSRTLLLLTLTSAVTLTACGDPTDTLPPDENAGRGGMSATGGSTAMAGTNATGGTSANAGNGGSSGSVATGGSAGSAGSSSGGSAGSGGAAGSGGSGGGTPVTWQEVSFAISGSCAKSMCHNGMQQPSLLAMPAAAQYAVLTTHAVGVCGSAIRLVTPGDVANSAILKLVNGECMLDGEPFIMPADCTQAPCLPAAQVSMITNWILSGAPGPL
jgi:hypothetical protein